MALTKVDAQLLNGAVTADSSGNVGIGTGSPSTYANGFSPVEVIGTGNNWATIQGRTDGPSGASNGVSYGVSYSTNPINGARIWIGSQGGAGQQGMIGFFTKNTDDNTNQPTERMRIDSSGALLIGTSSAYSANYRVSLAPISTGGIIFKNASTSAHYPLNMLNSSGSSVGYIESSNTAVSYVTSSDYRLKENIAPMQNALNVVQQLKPVTYTWKADGSDGQGFIAHELQAVVPDCVTGEKDAVDADGNPIYQGIDTSFLVATLTAAIQELKAELDATKAEVAALKAAA